MSTTSAPRATRSHSVPIKGGRFLIIGGASLVGSASAELFLKEGAAEVTILDNFFQGSHDAIMHLEGDKRLKVVQGDVMRLPQLIEATKGVDGVLHLAAVMTITMDRDPWTGLDVNIRGTQNAIEACSINGVKKFVFTSSTAVYGYGPGIVGDLVETTPFHSVGSPPAAVLYGATKIIGEQLCRTAFAKRGLDYVVVRYATVYGERQHYRAANALYIIETHDRVRRGERPRVIGDGSEAKHFVHVSDAARANAAAFTANAHHYTGDRAPSHGDRRQEARARAYRTGGRQSAPDVRRCLAARSRARRAHNWLASRGRYARRHTTPARLAREVKRVGRNSVIPANALSRLRE
jgi:UDP-glucose 4-epimerase